MTVMENRPVAAARRARREKGGTAWGFWGDGAVPCTLIADLVVKSHACVKIHRTGPARSQADP